MISQAVKLTIAVESEEESLTGETDESYAIDIYKSPGKKVKQIPRKEGKLLRKQVFYVHYKYCPVDNVYPIDMFLKLPQ